MPCPSHMEMQGLGPDNLHVVPLFSDSRLVFFINLRLSYPGDSLWPETTDFSSLGAWDPEAVWPLLRAFEIEWADLQGQGLGQHDSSRLLESCKEKTSSLKALHRHMEAWVEFQRHWAPKSFTPF